MKQRLLRLFLILCVMILAVGCAVSALAEDSAASAAVTVVWNDEDDADALRPASLTATLYNNGAPCQQSGADVTAALNAANHWTAAVGGLDSAGQYTWEVSAPQGYRVSSSVSDGVTVITATHQVEKIKVSAALSWADDNNAQGKRPGSVSVRLLADGKPQRAAAALNSGNSWSTTWTDLPKYSQGKEIAYTVEQVEMPAYYTAAISGSAAAGYTITDTLGTGTLTIQAGFSGLPANAPTGSLSITISGPDSRMPMTLLYSSFKSSAYTISNVLPGAYLAQENNAASLMEGYVLDTRASETNGGAQVAAGGAETILLVNAYRAAEDTPAPVALKPVSTADLGKLQFRILGPDPSMPMTILYSQFENGYYRLKDLVPGSYVVYEMNEGTLLETYTLTTDSTTAMMLSVGGATAHARLVNLYTAETPAPTPTPDVTETPNPDGTETPAPSTEPAVIDIPVTKVWVDNNNKDGNRPAAITVRLYADGVETASAQLSAATGWQYTFTGLPKLREGEETEIQYTITEDPVEWYTSEVTGFTVINTYHPEVTSISVRKVWNDSNNAAGMRPASIHVTLSNGMSVVLSASNGWMATVDNLPTRLNGQPAVYTWHEQVVLGYVQTGNETNGSLTTIINSMYSRPEPPEDKKVPKKKRGEELFVIDDYDTPLGVEVIINHVGDCFD